MSSNLRPLYDQLYVGVKMWLLALFADRDAGKRGHRISPYEGFDRDFKRLVVPYWKPYGIRPKKAWYKLYCAREGTMDPRYIPTDLWCRRIVPHYNKLLFAGALKDKCLLNLFVPDVKRPETVVKCVSGVFYDDGLHLLTEEAAVERCLAAERCIVKPSFGSEGGDGIRFFRGGDMTAESVSALFRQYGSNFIIQKTVRQHPELAAIYGGSLNTLRIISFFHKGQVYILAAILRMGSGEAQVDNVSQGGLFCRVRPDGTLDRVAYNKKSQQVTEHPGGFVFADGAVPGFDRLIETVKTCASRMSHFKLIGWDFAVDEAGDPVLIEYNSIPGLNIQMASGPLFGELTDEVLREIFRK